MSISDEIIKQKQNIINVIGFCIILGLVYLTCYELYLAHTDPSSNITSYIFLIVVPFLIVVCYFVHLLFDQNAEIQFFYFAGILAIFFVIFYFLIFYMPSIDYSVFMQYLLIFLGVLLGLALIYWIFIKKLNNWDTWEGFFVNMIFYIPCMITDAIQYMANDVFNTSTQITILFGIEIVILLLYLYALPAIDHSIYTDGILVLNLPVFLNTKQDIGGKLIAGNYTKQPVPYYNFNYEYLRGPQTYRRNYAVSLWIYMNTMPNTKLGYAKETDVFYYGSYSPHTSSTSQITPTQQSSFHPKITYSNETGVSKYNLYYSGNTSKHDIELPGQKWNNLVFNYRDDGVDVFVNGELTVVYTFSDDYPEYTATDTFSVGDANVGSLYKDVFNTNSLYGSVCSVAYYVRPLTREEIVRNYNVLSVRNPPILDK